MNLNLLTIIFLVVLIYKVIQGYKKGMVKEIISFISLIVLCIIVGLLGTGLKSYLNKEIINVIAAFLLLCLMGVAHHLLGLIFFPAKMIAKLPIVSWLDKLLGMVVGALEIVLIMWTIYAFIMTLGLGMIGQHILAYTEKSPFLLWLYQNNYLVAWISKLGGTFAEVQF